MLIPYGCTVHGIQVYENNTDDITTATTKLTIVPTSIVKIEGDVKDSVTESTPDLKEQDNLNNQMVITNTSANVTLEKTSRKKEGENIVGGRK